MLLNFYKLILKIFQLVKVVVIQVIHIVNSQQTKYVYRVIFLVKHVEQEVVKLMLSSVLAVLLIILIHGFNKTSVIKMAVLWDLF